jgi:hypothetical protein
VRWPPAGAAPRVPPDSTLQPLAVYGLRYLDLTLSALVGDAVTIRYDPRDMAEIRVWHQDIFICRAITPELAAGTITLKQPKGARAAVFDLSSWLEEPDRFLRNE